MRPLNDKPVIFIRKHNPFYKLRILDIRNSLQQGIFKIYAIGTESYWSRRIAAVPIPKNYVIRISQLLENTFISIHIGTYSRIS